MDALKKVFVWIWNSGPIRWLWFHVLDARRPGKDNPFKGEWGVAGWFFAIIIAMIGVPVLSYIGATMGSYVDFFLFIAGGPPGGDPFALSRGLTSDPSRNPLAVTELMNKFTYTFTILGALGGGCIALLFAWFGGTALQD